MHTILIAEEAAARLRAFQTWWDANRPAARPDFKDALANALASIAEFPNRFPKYSDRDVQFCRIDKTPYLLLFEVNSSDHTVTVIAAWSAALGEAP